MKWATCPTTDRDYQLQLIHVALHKNTQLNGKVQKVQKLTHIYEVLRCDNIEITNPCRKYWRERKNSTL